MSEQQNVPGETPAGEPRGRAVAGRMALIGAVVAALAGAFAYTAGWFSPGRVSGARIVDALQANGGLHRGYRRAHAKGMCVVGHFDSNGRGQALSTATVFRPGRVPLVGRFSTGGGDPFAPDGRLAFHGLALRFLATDGQDWRTAMDDTPIFPVADGRAFYDFQTAYIPDPATGKPDPARAAAYLAAHPETRAFMQWMKTHPLPSSFANGTYHGINAFRFIDAAGQARAVRWSLQPEAAFASIDQAALAAQPRDFLFHDLTARLRQGPLRWHLRIALGQPGDPTDDATRQWPDDRPQVDVGTVEIARAVADKDGPCNGLTFDPLILPPGIAPSDDPLLSARSAAYAASYARRANDPAPSHTVLSDTAVQSGETTR
jgi:catalase